MTGPRADINALDEQLREANDALAWEAGKLEVARAALVKLRAKCDALAEALRASAERHHGLSDEPGHLGHVFADCPVYECAEARAALDKLGEDEAQGWRCGGKPGEPGLHLEGYPPVDYPCPGCPDCQRDEMGRDDD